MSVMVCIVWRPCPVCVGPNAIEAYKISLALQRNELAWPWDDYCCLDACTIKDALDA